MMGMTILIYCGVLSDTTITGGDSMSNYRGMIYGEQPNHVIIHPTQYVEGLVVDGIDIHTSRLVTPNHYLIGRKQAVQAAA